MWNVLVPHIQSCHYSNMNELNLSKTSFKELCFKYLQECLENNYESSFTEESSFMVEIYGRLKVKSGSLESCLVEARNMKLISKLDLEEVYLALRIAKVSANALGKLNR